MSKFTVFAKHTYSSISKVDIYADSSKSGNCQEFTIIHFQYEALQVKVSVFNSMSYKTPKTELPLNSQTDYIIALDADSPAFSNPLSISELADLLFDSKKDIVALMRSQCKHYKEDFPSCFSLTKESITADIENGKLLQSLVPALADEYKV